MNIKFLLLGAGIIGSMIFLVILGMDGDVDYYVDVTEFLAQPDLAEDDYRVNGKVVEGTIVRMNTGEDVTFEMSDGSSSMAVAYHGIIPDTFVDGADVVVKGRLTGEGTFEAHTLLAKCPSKYEAAEDAATTASGNEYTTP
ncbi:MAG: cytochrome c maturation protein CcmE [bacterium]|nr:cytochrome c maturation protein CcmE [bacterium]